MNKIIIKNHIIVWSNLNTIILYLPDMYISFKMIIIWIRKVYQSFSQVACSSKTTKQIPQLFVCSAIRPRINLANFKMIPSFWKVSQQIRLIESFQFTQLYIHIEQIQHLCKCYLHIGQKPTFIQMLTISLKISPPRIRPVFDSAMKFQSR